MAEGKKSFVAYSDWYGMFKALPDEVAGKLIKHIFSYVNDENPTTEDFVINALFEQVKSTLKRDLKKWEEQQEQRKQAGIRSAEIRKQNATLVNARSFSSTDSVSVNGSVSVSDNVKDKNKRVVNKFTPPSQIEVIDYFNQNGYSNESAIKAFNYYETGNWKDGKGNKVKNWKQKMQSVWFKEDNKIKPVNKGYDYNNVRGKLS